MDKRMTVMIVDDVQSNIIALENLLEENDRVFINATNGNDALKIALSNSIDLIILDVQMAGMDGFEVAKLLKSNRKTKEIPIIFASAAKKEHFSMLKGFKEGAIDYLLKPLDPDLTRAKVSILLELQLQKRELIEKNNSLEKSALLINNSMDIIGVIDPVLMCFEQVNEAASTILGYQENELIGKPLYPLLDTESANYMHSLVSTTAGSLSFETVVSTVSAQSKCLQWRVAVKEGKWFVNVRDVTQEKLADDKIKQLNQNLEENIFQLKNTNRELESFTYSVSHDLRAPLRAITGYAKILQEDYASTLNEDTGKFLAIILRNSFKMGELIEDLLEFSRLGRKEIKKIAVDTENMVQTILEDLNLTEQQKQRIQIQPLPPSFADRNLLAQVWVNLISNAIKYSSKNNDFHVEIGAINRDDNTVYYVKDNGVGFNMEYANKLFAVFQRLHDNSEFEGTGIGLAIADKIISRHGGKIWAEAKENEGAQFFFTLPNN